MTFGSTFGRVFSPTFQPKSQAPAAASSWWLAGGIDPSNCIVAYQPKGAADYAASKVNLADSGTYDAADGSAYPAWDATNGWKFTETSSQYLKTGFQAVAGNYYSAICRFSDVTYINTNLKMLFGGRDSSTNSRFYIAPVNTGPKHLYGWSNETSSISGALSDGVACVASGKIYLDGAEEESRTTSVLAATGRTIYIGAQNYGDGTTGDTAGNFLSVYVQAIAFYNIALTSTQVGLLTTAMNAL